MIPDFRGIIDRARAAVENAEPLRCEAGFDSAVIKGDFAEAGAMLKAMMTGGVLPEAALVYMDPPFLTGEEHTAPIKLRKASGAFKIERKAYSDKAGVDDYLTMLASAMLLGRDLLSHSGSLWVHLDSRAVHYARILADEIFGGRRHLVNEIIWYYKSGGSGSKRFSNKHDTLLFYAKDPKQLKFRPQKEKSYNRGMRPYRFKGVREYRDDIGWYTLVNMKDVWEIPMVGRTSKERTGYATQKPMALQERILTSCTEEGDLCIDLFGGSGTMAAAARRMGRRWVSVDKGSLASAITESRLMRMPGPPFALIGSGGETVGADACVRDEATGSDEGGEAAGADACVHDEATGSDGGVKAVGVAPGDENARGAVGVPASLTGGGARVTLSATNAAEVETVLAGPGVSLLIESYTPSKEALLGFDESERSDTLEAAAFDPSQFIVLADVRRAGSDACLRLVDIFGEETLLPLEG